MSVFVSLCLLTVTFDYYYDKRAYDAVTLSTRVAVSPIKRSAERLYFAPVTGGRKRDDHEDEFWSLIVGHPACFVGFKSDGRPLRRLSERSSFPVSSILVMLSRHSFVGHSRQTRELKMIQHLFA